MPETNRPTLNQGSSSTDSTNGNSAYPEPAYPFPGIFVQESSFQSATSFSLPVDFNDSFLVRGKELSKIVRALPNTTQFCLVGKYTYLPGTDKFLILSGKPKSYTDLVKKTTEFYLQVEPANDAANQNDCLNYNLTNTLFATASNPTVSFSLTQLCTDCTGAVTSGGLALYYSNGEAVPTLNLASLLLTISGSTSTGGNSCVESTVCQARSYDCCLDGQCVNDGAVKPGAITDPGFASAQADVASNPLRFVLYPQYYFVCPNRPDGSTSGGSSGGGTDPDYEAAIRLLEMGHLYQCLNQVDGEFAHCTVKFTGASSRIPGTFSVGESAPNVLEYKDDMTFAGFNPTEPTLVPPFATNEYRNRNIVKIFYGGQVLYDATVSTPIPLSSGDGSFVARSGCTTSSTNDCSGNDDLSNAAIVNITKILPTNAVDDNLYLTYRVDGTCTKLGASLARCSKTYYQNSSDPSLSTYHNNTKIYYLPNYADLSMSVVVKLSDVILAEDAANWTRAMNPNRITFTNTPATNQKIEITYYVTSDVDALTKSRTAARARVNSMCQCGTTGTCNLKPVYSSENVLTNYECVYSTTTTTEPPVNQTVFVNNKNVPHRYYDTGGVVYDEDFASAPPQEGTAFTYFNNDLLKPSNTFTDATTINLNAYVGFNEIYGSFAKTGNQTAKPAKLVKVKKDKYYDIYVNTGSFSACPTCGSDYYSTFQKLFPQNFVGKGGGYTPDNYESKRENSSSIYRSDDLLFGRACFVPATMIPWTHVTQTSDPLVTSVQKQRLSRLAGQHFLFANGYQRDWFGFDYGSLIGSFDGVTWFSVGNQRRIKATTNKLFLAVNAYFGDLSVDSNFSVTVSETVTGAATIPDHDTKTDGAECQKSHYCSTDNDCFRQLGYEYSCQNVAGLTTNWPQFDGSANEIIGSTNRTLSSIVGGTSGQSKRCVYRGRGAPCTTSLSNPTGTFNSATTIGALACSSNNMCQSLTTGSTARFNTKIARFANSPNAQNLGNTSLPVSDTVGLGARLIGRPNDYYGSKAVPSGTFSSASSLAANGVSAVCTPGRNVSSATTTFGLNSSALPTNRKDTSDKMFGVGATMSGTLSLKYLNACPATDTLGYSVQTYDLPLGVAGSDLEKLTASQNLSTNLLNMTSLVSAGIYNSSSGTTDTPISAIGYQRNACLRAPGAACFSNMECAPSDFIATKVRSLDLSSVMNTAEEKYWEEDLVCGNPDFKYVATGVKNPLFDVKKNFCCREYGKTITVYTENDTSTHHWCDTSTEKPKIAGVNLSIASTNRYSRVNTAYDKITCDRDEISSTKTFALSTKAPSNIDRFDQILYQFKTLDTINSRTCCTQNWVRSFATTNGGGHAWSQSKQQTLDKAVFEPLNWNANDTSTTDNPTAFECQAGKQNYPSCEIKNFTDAEVDKYLTFFGSLELLGIPQVAVKVAYPNNSSVSSDDMLGISVAPRDGSLGTAQSALVTPQPVQNTVMPYTGSNADFEESSTKLYYSAGNLTRFKTGTGQLKQVFSDSEFNCCIPSNQEVPTGTTATQCCTGYVANSGASSVLRCCLPDYTDVTLYLNRYVSSEGRGLPDSAYDAKTGYIKDPGVVEVMAAQKNLCCSGKMVRGVAIWRLFRPLTGGTYLPQVSNDNMTRRFVTRDDAVDNNAQTQSVGSIYDAGVRWNNHLYCVPASFQDPYEQ